jgi:hypothetical protein
MRIRRSGKSYRSVTTDSTHQHVTARLPTRYYHFCEYFLGGVGGHERSVTVIGVGHLEECNGRPKC